MKATGFSKDAGVTQAMQELDYARLVVKAANTFMEHGGLENYEGLQFALHQYHCFMEGETCRCMEDPKPPEGQ